MRIDTIYASSYLVSRLQHANTVKHVRDDGDIILLDMHSGEQILILLVDRIMNLSEVEYYYQENTGKGIATLMLVWVDIFIPLDGASYVLTDWMHALDSLHDGKLYGYDVAGRMSYFFPVYLEGKGKKRTIRYGNVVDYLNIGSHQVESESPYLRGVWQVAEFYDDSDTEQFHIDRYRHGSPLAVFYEVLGLKDGTSLDQVKKAYYRLAQMHHPDTNNNEDAHRKMSTINNAYQRITQYLSDDN